MGNDFYAVKDRVDWTSPLFKLTYRYDPSLHTPKSLLNRLVQLSERVPTAIEAKPMSPSLPINHLRVSRENLGDDILIIAAVQMLARAGLTPVEWADRDNEIANLPRMGRSGILLNGWLKANPAQ